MLTSQVGRNDGPRRTQKDPFDSHTRDARVRDNFLRISRLAKTVKTRREAILLSPRHHLWTSTLHSLGRDILWTTHVGILDSAKTEHSLNSSNPGFYPRLLALRTNGRPQASDTFGLLKQELTIF